MKNVALVANLALAVRVALVGGFLILLPRITRKGLLFGAYIGEETADSDPARRLRGEWPRGCVLVMLLSLAVGYSTAMMGSPVAGSLIGTAVLIVAGFSLYIRFHFRARELVSPETARQATQATASLRGGASTPGARLAWCALLFCVVVSVAAFVYALVSLGSDWTHGSFVRVTFVPGVSLWVCPFLAVLAVLTANAKRSLRGGSGGCSAEAQEDFRAGMTRALSLIAIVICAVLTMMSLELLLMHREQLERPRLGFWFLAGFAFLFIIATMIQIMRRYGQGGALQENGSAEAPLTNGLADNARWVFGLFYVDPDDPSIMVENRFGFGYSFNYGNRTAIQIIAAFLALAAALVVFWLAAPMLGGG